MQTRTGRIPLNQVVQEWGSDQVLNPRTLAGEVAAALRTMMPENHPIHETHASAVLLASTKGSAFITYGALADYFDSFDIGQPAETINTNLGPAPANAVLIWRQWIGTLTTEACERALGVIFKAQPMNDSASIAMTVEGNLAHSQSKPPSTPSGSAPGYMQMRQASLRQEGELRASEQLDIAQLRAQHLEAANAVLTGRLALSESDLSKEREARGTALQAQLAAEERAEAAEIELAEAPSKIAADFATLGRSLTKASAWFTPPPSGRGESTNRNALLVVAGLLELLLDHQRPKYKQDTAADAIALRGWRGAGKRQVNDVFAKAKREAKDARSEATAKADGIKYTNTSRQD